MELKKAYTSRDNIGRVWVVCPYCKKRIIPVTSKTKIKYMEYICKKSLCKKKFVIQDVGYKPYKPKDTQCKGQMSLKDFNII